MSGTGAPDDSSPGRPTRLGPYELMSSIGRGGMGEVYRGRDTRLNRTVAVKILPPDMAHSAEARRRFQREAQAIAALNHRHVCAVHDVGHDEGVDFLVMEFVDGESLATRLGRGPMPFDEVLARGIEILDALAHAHEAGIVHRDLKPSNIMMTKSGAKLLDFGIAALRRDLRNVDSVSDTSATAPGQVFGTLQYMAPEQLEGTQTDARTDIFAFGLVLYEMATGRKAIEGSGTTAIATAILTGRPASISEVLTDCPADVDWAIRRCLARDRAERWQSAADLSAVLRRVSNRPAAAGQPATVAATRRWTPLAAAGWSIALALALASAGLLLWKSRSADGPPARTIRATIPVVAGGIVGADGQPAIALSPDGRRMVYAAAVSTTNGTNATTSLYLRLLDRLDSVPIAGTEGAFGPFFSADGTSVAFFAGRKLKRVSFDGTPPIVICDAPRGRGGSWSSDDTIVFAPTTDGPLHRVSATGGRPEPISTLSQTPRERSQRWPELLPDGRTVLYTSGNPTDNTLADSRIMAQPIDRAADRRVVVENGSQARYSAGHLLYFSGNALMAVPFDPGKAQVTGAAFTVVDAVSGSRFIGAAQAAVSRQGTLVYLPPGGGGTFMTAAWVTRAGTSSPIAAVKGMLTGIRLSPDGRRIAFSSSDADADVFVYDLTRQALKRLTYTSEFEGNPVWTRDGTRVVYASERGPAVQMLWKRWDDPRGAPGALAQRPVEDEALAPGDYARIPHAWSPDGALLAFTENHPDSRRDIWLMPAAPGGKSFPLVVSPFEDNAPTFSPDGQWVAYQSNESGGDEIYARRIKGDSTRVQISPAGGAQPRWAPNGDLFYWFGGKMFVIAAHSKGEALEVGEPTELFTVGPMPNYDVAADGQQLLMLQPGGGTPPKDLVVVEQWASRPPR
jgi:Tol biopolymer transport system component